MKTPSRWLVLFALFVVQTGFGGYSILVKKFAQDHGANPLVFSLGRDVFAFPVLLVGATVFEGWLVPSLSELPIFLFLGLTGMFGNQFLFILGLYWTTPDIAAAFQPLIPIWTTIGSALLRLDQPRTSDGMYIRVDIPLPLKISRIAGVLSAAGGALWMLLGRGVDGRDQDEPFWGAVALGGNTLCMAMYILAQNVFLYAPTSDPKRAKMAARWRARSLGVTAYSYAFGAMLMLLASAYYMAEDPDVFLLPAQSFVPLSYSVVVSSVLCYWLITWSNRHINPTVVTAFFPVQVFVVIFLAWLVFDDVLEWSEWLGAGLIILGLLAVCWANYKMQGVQEAAMRTYNRPRRAGEAPPGTSDPEQPILRDRAPSDASDWEPSQSVNVKYSR